MSVWLIIPPVLTTLGLGLLIQLLLDGLTSLVQGRLRRRLKFVLSLGARPVADDQPLSEAALYGLPPQLTIWMLAAAGGGVLLSLLTLSGPARTLGLVAGLLPLLWKRRRIGRTQHQVRQQVAALIEDMRLRLAFGSTLGAVLHAIADEPDRAGVVYDRLRFHRDRLALAGPEDLLRRLSGRCAFTGIAPAVVARERGPAGRRVICRRAARRRGRCGRRTGAAGRKRYRRRAAAPIVPDVDRSAAAHPGVDALSAGDRVDQFADRRGIKRADQVG